jgi:histidinol-phosphate aminotransferase
MPSNQQHLQPIHGSTDAGPPPKFDFSSNANALGPNPIILKTLQQVDPTHYPDPNYTALHTELAQHYQVEPAQIAVGAGASELILRLANWHRSTSLLTFSHTFGEYSRVAYLSDSKHLQAQSQTEFLALLPQAKLAFICIPNNPTGEIYSQDFLAEVATTAKQTGTIVIADLAYLALSQTPIAIPPTFWQLHAPNKAHGMTGIRAGYLVAPTKLLEFRNYAPSWVLSVHGEAFLRSTLQPAAQAWVKQCCPTLWEWRDRLQQEIAQLNLTQQWSQTNFGLIQVGNATAITQILRQQDIRVRDCTSFGLPEWIRVSAQSSIAQMALINALSVRSTTLPTSCGRV